jgi:pimeloyl-ACP methyl ester carboxylesterase
VTQEDGMHVLVNGVRLFFDVEGAKLVPDGPDMREKPTLLLLHGGPGFDHSIYKPAYSALTDMAQVIYLDQRGTAAARTDHARHGRSHSGATMFVPSAMCSGLQSRSCSVFHLVEWSRSPMRPAIRTICRN